MPSAWNKLPFEVMTTIFEYTDAEKKGIQSKKKDFYNYQLVCKGWSKAAQIHLYRDINLDAEPLHTREAAESLKSAIFLNTVGSLAPYLGAFVKKMTLCDTLYRFDRPLEALGKLLDACPNMRELYCNENVIDIVWPYLLTLPDTQLINLKSFHKDAKIASSSLYPFVAFKLRKNLTNLQLCIDYANMFQQKLGWGSNYLMEQLPQFVALKSLHFTGCRFLSYMTLCRAIDRCNPTVSKLSFDKFIPHMDARVTLGEVEISIIKPNYGVKEIYMKTCLLHSAKYLAVKFRNLEKFTVDRLNPIDVSSGWFAGLAELCVSLKKYDLCFNFMREKEIKDDCVELTSRAPHAEKRLLIEYNVDQLADEEDEEGYPPWRIALKKDGSSSSIEVYVPEDDTDFNYHTHWLERYYPTEIEIRKIDSISKVFMNVSNGQYENYTTQQVGFTEDFAKYMKQISMDSKNWMLFDKVISCTANTPNARIVLSEMAIIGLDQEVTTRNIIYNSNIKRLALENSILDGRVFEIMSLRLPKLDTLIIDACLVLMDEPYTLKIFLPWTKLQRLGLVVAPIPLFHAIRYHRSSSSSKDAGRRHLGSAALIQCMSLCQAYTLKIETDAKTYVTTRMGNNEIVSNTTEEQDIRQGTENKFLIWIRCGDLKEFSIVHRPGSRLSVAHRFEQLD